MIYYPSSAGGGMKELFRKVLHFFVHNLAFCGLTLILVLYMFVVITLVWSSTTCLSAELGYLSDPNFLFQVGNRSSEFHPEVRRVRREGSYIYEEFLPTWGTDVKVLILMLLDKLIIFLSMFEATTFLVHCNGSLWALTSFVTDCSY